MVEYNNSKKIHKKYLFRFTFVFIIILIIVICLATFFSLSNDKSVSDTEIPDTTTSEAQPEIKEEQVAPENKQTQESKPENKEPYKVKINSNDNQKVQNNYSNLYPELRCQRPSKQITPVKTIFLTFDDGPSERTPEVLDILNRYGIKATFFVTGNASAQGKAWMKRIVDEGHAIGIHTYTHNFKQIYANTQAFLDDFNKIYNLIYEATGVKATIFRFPGGSKNSFNKSNYRELINEMTNRGFDYFDWNLSAGDAVSRTPTPAAKCASNILNYSANYNDAVVLMHDARPKRTTVEALPSIIEGLKKQGFSFDKLSHEINPESYSLVKPYR